MNGEMVTPGAGGRLETAQPEDIRVEVAAALGPVVGDAAATSKDLVGPLRDVVHFRDGSVVRYTPPADTVDPRYEACTEHRVACDCREAEHAETMSEFAGMWRAVQEAADRVLRGHPTHAWWRDPETGEDVDVSCLCTGCQIARAVFLRVGGPSMVAAERAAGGEPR